MVDARNRLAAAELERRWNEKLQQIETTQQQLSSLEGKRYSLSSEEEARVLSMGENFAEAWQSDSCPPTPKKMIFRTAIEEIIVRTNAKKESLHFMIHWNGGVHTQLEMDRPRSSRYLRNSIDPIFRSAFLLLPAGWTQSRLCQPSPPSFALVRSPRRTSTARNKAEICDSDSLLGWLFGL